MRRRCLEPGCNELTDGSRCTTHRKQQRSKYAGAWPAHSRATIAAHVNRYGPLCPGWNVPPHESHDLTTDHDVGVLCRPCNSRKKQTGDG